MRSTLPLFVLLTIALVAAACGGSTSQSSEPTEPVDSAEPANLAYSDVGNTAPTEAPASSAQRDGETESPDTGSADAGDVQASDAAQQMLDEGAEMLTDLDEAQCMVDAGSSPTADYADRSEAEAMVAALADCTDLRATLVRMTSANLPEPVAQCFVDGMDDDQIEWMIVEGAVGGEAAVMAGMDEALMGTLVECMG